MAARLLMHPESRGRLCGAVAGAPVSYWEGCAPPFQPRALAAAVQNGHCTFLTFEIPCMLHLSALSCIFMYVCMFVCMKYRL
jgi:hypothetical protein